MLDRNAEFTRIAKLFNSRQYPAADGYARQALKRYPNEFFLNNLIGGIADMQNRPKDALKYFGKAVKIDPANKEGLLNYGNSLRVAGQLFLAQKTLKSAIKIDKTYPEAWNNLGLVYADTKQNEDAIAAFKQALKLRPEFDQAQLNLFALLDRASDIAGMNAAVQEALAKDVTSNSIRLYQGIVCEAESKFEEAKELLGAISFDINHSRLFLVVELLRVLHLAKVLDKLNEVDDAYKLFERSNELNALKWRQSGAGGSIFLNRLDKRKKYFSKGFSNNWQDIPEAPKNFKPVFMVGFPRSGTTLLDTFLRGHAEIAVIEEQPLVPQMCKVLGTHGDEKFDNIDNIKSKTVLAARSVYMSELRKAGGNKPVNIDKFPLNLTRAGEIIRMFPDAKFIFSVRDPADCVLSCFMQPFDLNLAMASTNTVLNAARLYNKSLSLWEAISDELKPNVHFCRYEDLIDQPEETLRPILDFLDLDWQDQVLEHQKTALARDKIKTPSYNQVVKPLYKTAVKRWQKYEHHFPEALEILAPWRKYFGYDK